MNNQLFSHINNDYYVRHYELNPEFTDGHQVTVYAECSPNTTGANGHYYALDLYFSADNLSACDYYIGVTFGEGKMDKESIEEQMDIWVEKMMGEDSFPLCLNDYILKEKMWESAQSDEQKT